MGVIIPSLFFSDLVFDPTMVPALVGAISKLLTRGGVAYIASTIRNPDTHRGFLLELCEILSLL